MPPNLTSLCHRSQVLHLCHLQVAYLLEDNHIFVQRVCREIDAYELLLLVESLQGSPGLSFRYGRRIDLHLIKSEERV